MSKDLDSKEESAPPSGEPEKKPASKRATSKLIPVRVIETHGQSALVQYGVDGISYRSYVDPKDIQDGKCPAARLQDAPYGIQWKFDFAGLAQKLEIEIKARGIWTYDDLIEKGNKTAHITTRALGPIIWAAAKREQ